MKNGLALNPLTAPSSAVSLRQKSQSHSPSTLACASRHYQSRLSKLHSAQIALKMAIDSVKTPELHCFLLEITNQPEIRESLQIAVGRDGMRWKFQIDSLHAVAQDVRHAHPFEPHDRDGLYVCTLLVGIRHLLAQRKVWSADADTFFTAVQGALGTLKQAKPKLAALIQMCLGWDQTHKQTLASKQLQARMGNALDAFICCGTPKKKALGERDSGSKAWCIHPFNPLLKANFTRSHCIEPVETGRHLHALPSTSQGAKNV
ncbi:MAG: hypothetical protein K9K38_09075 [Rhodoferax sp.]|nr:hypothetical protein [Rhodoferax sp.]MCF8209539.1 hypothetical protein [Rhodoferax sp.]